VYISGVESRETDRRGGKKRGRGRARELILFAIFVLYVETENTFKKKGKGRLA